MIGYLDFLFLSYSGRIGRTAYWLGLIVLWAVQLAAIIGLVFLARLGIEDALVTFVAFDEGTLDPAASDEFFTRLILPIFIVSLLFLYPTYAITTKRWHDRNKSGWWSLIAFVPIIGGLWMLIECGFLGGSDGTNAYGPDPAFA